MKEWSQCWIGGNQVDTAQVFCATIHALNTEVDRRSAKERRTHGMNDGSSHLS